MDHLFVVVGMSNVGKSTLIRRFCTEEYTFDYFKHDDVCHNIRMLFGVSQFDIRDDRQWAKMNQLGNPALLSYWIHLMILGQVEGRVAFAEGYRYYYVSERTALELAVQQVHMGCAIHYIHLDPPLSRRNEYLKSKGRRATTEDKVRQFLSKMDLDFFSFEISCRDELEEVVRNVVGEIESTACGRGLVTFPDVPEELDRAERELQNMRVLSSRSLKRAITGGRLFRSLLRT